MPFLTQRQIVKIIPGFEAPVILAYSARNRSASAEFSNNEPESTE